MKHEIQDALNRRLSGFHMDEEQIHRVLRTARGEKPVKKKISAGLVLAMVLILLTALAVAAEISGNVLSDMYQRYFGVQISPEGQSLLRREKPVAAIDFKEATLVIEQAVADENQLLVTATVLPKEKSNILLAMEPTQPEDAMQINGSIHPAETYQQAMERTGAVMKAVSLDFQVEGMDTPGGHAFENLDEQGRLRMVFGADYALQPGTIQVTVHAIMFEPGEGVTNPETHSITMPVQVVKLIEKTVKVDAVIPGSKIRVEEIILRKSPFTMYYQTTYRYDEKMEDSLMNPLVPPRITYVGRNGHWIDGGMGSGSTQKKDGAFVVSGTLNLQDFPEELWLEVEGAEPNTWHGQLGVHISPADE